ncbi:rhodanese-like domain-containing protein [bacterium]|nr:rhodanese-like domain-containing protein [bacterium]
MTCLKMNCQEFMARYRAAKPGTAVMLDVRNNEEVAQGMLSNAVHIPLGELGSRQAELDKSKEIFLYCRSGNRTQMALEILKDAGFPNVICSIQGGYDLLKTL